MNAKRPLLDALAADLADRTDWPAGEVADHLAEALTARPHAADPGTAVTWLTVRQVAESIGVSLQTVYSYRARGILPPPDHHVGARPVWRPATISRWKADRPGQGARTDLRPKP